MKKTFLFLLAVLGLFQYCKKTDTGTKVPGRFEIIANKSSVDGNLIMGIAMLNSNTFTIVNKNAPKLSAKISSDTVNGIFISPSTLMLDQDSIKVPLSGTPVIDGTFNMTVRVNVAGSIYICTKEFYVDLPDYSSITSSLPNDTTANDVKDSVKINFQINPYTTVFAIKVPPHLTAQITNNDRTNRTLTLFADNQFIAGDIVVTNTFRSVPVLVNTIHVSAFSGGDGSKTTPFLVADSMRLNKIQYAPDKAYQLSANIIAPKIALSGTTLSGSIDGNGKTISNCSLSTTVNNTGILASISTTGLVKNLTLSNITVSGADYTGGLTGVNNGTITNVTISGSVSGNNYIAAVTGNNFGTISSCDVSNANVSGINYMSTLSGNTNTGSSQTGNVVLSTPATYPTSIYGIVGTQNISLPFSPSTGSILVKSLPTGFNSSVSGQVVTVNPPSGFISGSMQLLLQSGKLSCTRNIMIYSKQTGAVFDAGDGSIANPFIISNEMAFDSIGNAPSKNYQLATDINLTKAWVPIPVFSGTLDGKGFKVNGLVINTSAANNGLTGTNTGTIKNIQFLNVNCTTNANTFGIISGTLNAGLIQNVIVSGILTSNSATDTLGGIAGTITNGGKITQCYGKLSITAACGMVGGIAGCLTAVSSISEISYCTTAGNIEITASKTRVGGILGRAGGSVVSGGIVKNCSSSMDIKSSGSGGTSANGFGGIFGADQNAGIVPIDQCLFSGTVTTGFSIGGIAGVGSNITNCIVTGQGPSLGVPMLYSNGLSPATGSVGGIAGTVKNQMQFCIIKNATLAATFTTTTTPMGGIVSTYQNNGYTAKSVIINSSITGSATAPNSENVNRISGTAANGTGINSSNYVGPNVITPNRTGAFTDNAAGLDGQIQNSLPFSFFTGLGFSSAIWKTDTDGYPTLINTGYNGGYTLP